MDDPFGQTDRYRESNKTGKSRKLRKDEVK
jgi:hypothetical protein